MRTTRFIVVVLCVVGLTASAAVAGDSNKELMKEVAAFGDAVAEAMMAEDVDAMLSMYAEDAISLPNYAPRMEGIDTFRKSHAEMSETGMKILSFTNETTEAWESGSQIIEIGTFTIEIRVPGMEHPVKDEGKFVTIYERDDKDNLKVKVEIWNSDHDPMAAMGGDHGHGHE